MSNIKFAGKTPMCVNPKCRKFYSMKKMDEAQTALAHETGLCPHCQANDVLVAKFSPVKQQPVVKSAPAVKPGKAVREAFMNLVDAGVVNGQVLTDFQDKEFILKHTGIKYAFIKEVDANVDLKEQTFVYGKARYSTKPLTIGGKQYLVTNDIYAKNVDRFMNLVKSFELPVAM